MLSGIKPRFGLGALLALVSISGVCAALAARGEMALAVDVAVVALSGATLYYVSRAPHAQPRHWVRSVAVVAAGLYAPFSWLILAPGQWDTYRLDWFKLWPILPGLVPGIYSFHPNDNLTGLAAATCTLVLLFTLTWLASRGLWWTIASAAIALGVSIPTAWIAYAIYRS